MPASSRPRRSKTLRRSFRFSPPSSRPTWCTFSALNCRPNFAWSALHYLCVLFLTLSRPGHGVVQQGFVVENSERREDQDRLASSARVVCATGQCRSKGEGLPASELNAAAPAHSVPASRRCTATTRRSCIATSSRSTCSSTTNGSSKCVLRRAPVGHAKRRRCHRRRSATLVCRASRRRRISKRSPRCAARWRTACPRSTRS